MHDGIGHDGIGHDGMGHDGTGRDGTGRDGVRLKAGMLVWLWLTALIVLLDQLSKYWANFVLDFAVPQFVIPGFDWLLLYNTGAAFSFLSDAGGWQRWFITGISSLVSLVLIIWLWRLSPKQKLLAVSLAFILGGALGNLYDRVMLGYVIDFISVHYGPHRFPSFNLADSAINLGAFLMILDIFLSKDSPSETADNI